MRLICCALAMAAMLTAQDLPRLGIGVKVSTLGLGVEAATGVTRSSNLRAGFNGLNYTHSFIKDGIHYEGTGALRSIEIHYDQFIGGLFHISPGLLIYNGNRVDATARVPGGSIFKLGGTTYFSTPADPVSGTGTLRLRKLAPMITAGVGNLLPRTEKHFSVGFEFGVVFQGESDVKLNLGGSNLASLPEVQGRIQAEQQNLRNDISPYLRFYPILSVGAGYKF